MDRVAAALQRDGVRPRRGDRDLRQRLGRVRGGLSRRAARRRRRGAAGAAATTAQSLAGMLADCGREAAVPRCRHGGELRCGRRAAPCRASRSTARRRRPRLRRTGWRPRAAGPRRSSSQPDWAIQHHLFLGHDRHAQGHRAAARDALGAGPTRGTAYGYGADAVTLLATPLYSNTTLVVLPADAGLRRHRGADGQVRRRRVPGAGRAAPRHAHDARAGAVPAHHGAARVRQLRPARRSA